MKQLRVYAILVVVFLFFLPSCTTFRTVVVDRQISPQSGFRPEWQAEFPGIDRAEARLHDPDLAVYCLRIKLLSPGVSVLVTPPDVHVPHKAEARLQKTTTFVKRYGLQAAINATPFSPESIFQNRPCLISGLSISGHTVVSSPARKYAAIVFSDNGTAAILSPDEAAGLPGSRTDVRYAAGGFSLLLRNGRITREKFDGLYNPERTARSAAGISPDGSILYLMVIDGKNPGYSIGATFEETACWLAAFGADSGIMLDGGGSSSLALADKAGHPRLLNIPVQGSFPYIERPVANHIGIYAR